MKTGFSIIVFFLISICNDLLAQSDSIIEKNNPVQFKLGVYYNSNLHYLGRTDSLKSSAVFPMAELWIGNGFYLNAAPIFVNNAVQSFNYEGAVATLGYRFSNSTGKFGGNLYFVKPLYKDESQLVQSSLKGQLSSSFTLSGKFLNIIAGGDLRFSDKPDYGVTGGIDHLLRFEPGKKLVLAFNPSAFVYAGTQQFTRSYYKQTNFLIFPGVEQLVNEEVKRFSILAYEFSMPIVLASGKLQFIANPAYVIPQNLIEIEGRPDLSERGTDLFYFTLGAKWNF